MLKPLATLALLVALVSTTACAPDDVAPPEPETIDVDAPEIVIPRHLDEDGQPQLEDHAVRFRDVHLRMHAIGIGGSIHRSSQMGHASYNAELAGDPMRDRGRTWVDQVQFVEASFNHDGALAPRLVLEPESGDWTRPDTVHLSDYSLAALAYHPHHRGDRFEDHGLYESMTYMPATYMTRPGVHLLSHYYSGGQFFPSRTHEGTSLHSMSHGTAGIHGLIYAYVRWHKPGGADDMGQLSEEQLRAWLQHTPDDLVQIAREIATAFDDAWDDEVNFYRFAEEPEDVNLETVGALLRGHKGLYEMLYVFGDDNDKRLAEDLFERSTVILEQVVDLAQPWGLPASVRFTDEGITAASDVVDSESLWLFVSDFTSGFSYAREREGTSRFLERTSPELMEAIGSFLDDMLQGALSHQFNEDGYLVSQVSLEDGAVVDDRRSTAAIGAFVTAAADAYGAGPAFASAGDWEEADEETVERSRALYDTILHHLEALDELFVADVAVAEAHTE